MAVYDYETPHGPAKAYYQTQTTNGSQGYFENFMGDQGTLILRSRTGLRGPAVPRPERARLGRVDPEGLHQRAARTRRRTGRSDSGAIADVRQSVAPDRHTVPVVLRDPYHQPHLQDFFDAVRGKAKLNCPSEVGVQTAVAVLKVNAAMEANSRLSFNPEDLKCRGGCDMENGRSPAARSIAITMMRVFVGSHFLYEG